ncbi:hypothetical protein HDU91_000887, partial [Kappamyces sp. JEL0680]
MNVLLRAYKTVTNLCDVISVPVDASDSFTRFLSETVVCLCESVADFRITAGPVDATLDEVGLLGCIDDQTLERLVATIVKRGPKDHVIGKGFQL